MGEPSMTVIACTLWLGAVAMVGGLVIECAALVGTKYYRLGLCFQWQVLGGMLFYVGAVVLLVAKCFG